MLTRFAAAATVAAAGLLAAGCGEDSQPLSKPEFIARANEICRASNDRLEPIFDAVWADASASTDGLSVFARMNESLPEIVSIMDQQLADIRELAPPADDAALVRSLLDDEEAAIDRIAELVEAAADGDQTAMAALDSDDSFDDIDRRASAYGLTVCAQN